MALTIGLPYPADASNSSNAIATPQSQSQSQSNLRGNPLKSDSVSQWLHALDLFDGDKPQEALDIFNQISPTNSKITYNIASIHSILGNYPQAITFFKKATSFDSYMAISHFQIGVSRFLAGSYAKAATSFNTALKLLRGNTVVNYQQLGLDYKLYSCEIVYNRALSYIYSGELSTGIFDLGFAAKEKKYIPEHNIIDEALTHFTEMENSQYKKQRDAELQNMLKLPGALDVRRQRFSVVNPPNGLYLNHGSSESLSSQAQLDKLSTSYLDNDMAYSLFSVPQGSLFRLTEIKVRSILNDKSLGEMMASKVNTIIKTSSNDMNGHNGTIDQKIKSRDSNEKFSYGQGNNQSSGANNNSKHKHISKHKNSNSLGGKLNFGTPGNRSDLPSLPSNSSPQKGSYTSSNDSTVTPSTSASGAGVLTPPISPDLSQTSNKSKDVKSHDATPNAYTPPSEYPQVYNNASPSNSNTSVDKINGQHFKSNNEYGSSSDLSDGIRSQTIPHSQNRNKESHGNKVGHHGSKPSVSISSSKHGNKASIGHSNNDSVLGLYFDDDEEAQINEHSSQKYSNNAYSVDQNHQASNSSQGSYNTKPGSSNNTKDFRGPKAKSPGKGNFYVNNHSNPSLASGNSSSQSTSSAGYSHSTVRVKIFCGKETRAIKINQGISFDEFKSRVANKVQGRDLHEDAPILSAISNNMILRIKDEDGDLVLIVDQEDLDVAISESFSYSKENPKLQVYVENVFDAEI